MNKDNAAQFLPLVQALAEGKTIQFNPGTSDNPQWGDVEDLSFDGNPDDYRVKPEPREWKIRFFLDGSAQVDIGGPAHPRGETIRVREIL
jgi:hypothetical protein